MSAPSPGAGARFGVRGRWPRAWGRRPPPPSSDPLRAAGQLLRESREARGLRLRDLAVRTRISIAVLEALERGWRDRLPEATHLRTMLPLLEQELDLPSGSLEPVLPMAGASAKEGGAPRGLVAALFAPFTSHVLSSWRGAVLYGLLMLALLHAVNLQQQRLAAMGRLAVSPIPLASLAGSAFVAPGGTPAVDQPDGAAPPFPDARPLARAAAGQALGLLARENQGGATDGSVGLLRLELASPTRLELRGRQGGEVRGDGLQGKVSLPVAPPFELRLRPAPGPEAVHWRGKPLRARTSRRGEQAVYEAPP